MGTLVLLCYLPNIPIFLKQLDEGGLGGWLAPPDRYWIADHAWWIAHTTWLLAIPLGLLLIVSFLGLQLKREGGHTGFWLLLFWGITPLVIGLAYSAWRAPVIQHSVLIFSFPYLAIALLMGLGELGKARTLLLCGGLAAIATYTLADTRQHYSLLYASNYETMLREGLKATDALSPIGVAVLLDAPSAQLDFFFQHLPIAPDPVHSAGRLDSLLRSLRQPVVVYGQSNGAPSEQLARIQLYFPHLVQRIDLAEGQVFILSRAQDPSQQEDRMYLAGACPICTEEPGWDIHQDMDVWILDPDSARCWDFTGREFGAAVRMQLDTIVSSSQDQVEIRARLYVPRSARNVALVVELKHADSTLFYRTAELDGLSVDPVTRELTLIVATRPGDAGLRKGELELVTYLYNREGSEICLLGMDVQLRRGNPVVYGITGPIEGTWTYTP